MWVKLKSQLASFNSRNLLLNWSSFFNLTNYLDLNLFLNCDRLIDRHRFALPYIFSFDCVIIQPLGYLNLRWNRQKFPWNMYWTVKSWKVNVASATTWANSPTSHFWILLGLVWASIFGAHKILKLLLFNVDRKGRSLFNVFGRVNRMTWNRAHAAAFAKHQKQQPMKNRLFAPSLCVACLCVHRENSRRNTL